MFPILIFIRIQIETKRPLSNMKQLRLKSPITHWFLKNGFKFCFVMGISHQQVENFNLLL